MTCTEDCRQLPALLGGRWRASVALPCAALVALGVLIGQTIVRSLFEQYHDEGLSKGFHPTVMPLFVNSRATQSAWWRQFAALTGAVDAYHVPKSCASPSPVTILPGFIWTPQWLPSSDRSVIP